MRNTAASSTATISPSRVCCRRVLSITSAASSGAITPASCSSVKKRILSVSGRSLAGLDARLVTCRYTPSKNPCFTS